MGLLSVRGPALLGLLLLAACEGEAPSHRGGMPRDCPDRMTPVPGTRSCIDRHEARIESGRAVPATGALPDDRLTWVEADAACRASGFRLCTIDEMERACGGADRERRFPYGAAHVPGRCNVAELSDDLTERSVARSGAHPECRTPEGVFDLSGNVMEWLADEGPGGGIRALRGGSAFQPEGSARCVPDEHGWLDPDSLGGGFRCCSTVR